ncbi:MAG: PEGA domain-containing protein [Myxococcota bacterium]
MSDPKKTIFGTAPPPPPPEALAPRALVDAAATLPEYPAPELPRTVFQYPTPAAPPPLPPPAGALAPPPSAPLPAPAAPPAPFSSLAPLPIPPVGASPRAAHDTAAEPVAMDRADEVMHAQELLSRGELPTALPPPPSFEDIPVEEDLPAPRASGAPLHAKLALGAALSALLCATLVSWRAIHDAARPSPIAEPRPAPPAMPARVAKPAASPDAPPAALPREIKGKFEGFSLFVDSVPDGAKVTVDGRTRGITPFLMNLTCIPGAELAVRVRRNGYQPWTYVGRCKADAILKLAPKLEKLSR